MTTMEVPQSFGYEQTLMYGRYSRNLAEEAKLELEKLKKERAKVKQQYDDLAGTREFHLVVSLKLECKMQV